MSLGCVTAMKDGASMRISICLPSLAVSAIVLTCYGTVTVQDVAQSKREDRAIVLQ
jgi:hypothetical protein